MTADPMPVVGAYDIDLISVQDQPAECGVLCPCNGDGRESAYAMRWRPRPTPEVLS